MRGRKMDFIKRTICYESRAVICAKVEIVRTRAAVRSNYSPYQ